MIARRSLATFLSVLFIALAMAPLATVTADSWNQGNVIINGSFRDPTPAGHPQKFYCGPNNPGAEDPTGGRTCDGGNAFVAFDWTAPDFAAAGVTLVADGIQLERVEGDDTTFIQQHFNGTDGPDTTMNFYGVTITARGLSANAGMRVDLRYDPGTGIVNAQKLLTFPATSTKVFLSPSDFGLAAGQEIKARSLRIWASDPLVIQNVEMHAFTTNPLNTFAPSIAVGGDDSVVVVGKAVVHAPGADGLYTWTVRAVDDLGETQPVEDAAFCVYYAEGFPMDGFSSVGGSCPSAILGNDQTRAYKTNNGDGTFTFNIPADLIAGEGVLPAGFYVWTSLEIDAPQHGVYQNNDLWYPGFYNVGQLAAIDAGHGATAADWDQMPTPVLFDRDSDGTPDYVQFSETDGYSVIITPELSTETPVATIVTTDVNGVVWFDVQVYQYEGALGAPMDLSAIGIDLGLFDGSGLTQPDGPKWVDEPFYTTDDGPVTRQRPDAFTIRFGIPASEIPANTPIGAWAYANLNGESRHTAASTFFGPQSGGTVDFYSVVRNAAKESVGADAMRDIATPILLDAASTTRDATILIRANAEADDLTPLDGTLVVGDKGDGAITFEYAMVLPEDRTNVPASGGHAIAVYDAAGYASDGGQIGATGMDHALWTGAGTLTDGWFRADIPLSAFEAATGPVAIWAYVDDVHADYTISRSGFYNFVKPIVASVSTTAAEKTLHAATPVVALDAALGIPLALSSTINGAPTDLISVTNPIVNPGFEANWFVEGGIENNDGLSAQMTSPPWFFRLDDKGTQQPTNPTSTHRVAMGKGQLGTNAMQISYKSADSGKGLMLGQLFGGGDGTDGLIWLGSTAVSFDVMSSGPTNLGITATLRYLDAAGAIQMSHKTITVAPSTSFATKTLGVTVPADGQLLGLYMTIESTSTQTILLDNIVVKGAKTALGDARSDLSDGFATIIEPRGLTGNTQDALSGTSADYYVYDVAFVDYTGGTPAFLDLQDRPAAFALRTQDFQTGPGTLLQKRGVSDSFTAIVAVGDEPAPLAAPWAWTEAGEGYQTFFIPEDQQSASGYYNPAKNALQATPLADQLDYGATPVAFSGTAAGSLVGQQILHFGEYNGAYALYVDAPGEFVETTTVHLTYPAGGGSSGVYSVVLGADTDNRVNGVLLTAAQVEAVQVVSDDTLFTKGAILSPGTPIPGFTVCITALLPTCEDQGIKTGESITFKSTSVAPNGEPLSITWKFGDNQVGSGATVTHSYTSPNVAGYAVEIKATSQSGKSATMTKVVGVNNRAPVVNPNLQVTPTPAFRDSDVRVRAIATDADGGSLAYAWTIDGLGVASVTTNTLRLSPAVLAEVGYEALVKGETYNVAVTVVDGQGGSTGPLSKAVVIGDHESLVAAPVVSVVGLPDATYALPGETIRVTLAASDSDDDAPTVALSGAPGSPLAMTQSAPGVYMVEFSAGSPAALDLAGVVTTLGGSVTGASTPFEIKANTAPTLALAGPTLLQAFETGQFNASAVDADNRTITYAWTLDGEAITATTAYAYATTGTDVGEHELKVTVSDGITSVSDTLAFAVDDVLVLTLSMVSAADEITDGHLLRVKLTDVTGQPLRNHPVAIRDFYEPLPAAIDTQNLRTDSNGEAVFRLKPEAALIGLPLTHRVVATASAASIDGAPVDDIETATTTMVFENEGPFAGLPLP